jgi:adenine-specific DNA-methyltransferase
MQVARDAIAERELLALSRRLRDLRVLAAKLKRSEMSPLQVCEATIERRLIDPTARAFFSGLPDDERHYWIASLYALLMPKKRRRKLAAYFTPPQLARHAIDVLMDAGIQPGRDRILDPASGGAAFLVPLATRIAKGGRERGLRSKTILQAIKSTLRGIEIEPGLAALSHALLANLFGPEIESTGIELDDLVQRADTLELHRPQCLYDAVIGNPPYGRIFRPSTALRFRFGPVITNGYLNLYALFVEQALQWVKPGGVISLVIPASFIGGPHFARLRKRILEKASVLRLDLIDKRSDVFVDVLYDLCILLLRKKDVRARTERPTSSLLLANGDCVELGPLEVPSRPTTRVWAIPQRSGGTPLFEQGLATLRDYGYLTKAGYFVWNRERERYRIGKTPRSAEVPLYWAHNIRSGANCLPRDHNGIGFVKIDQANAAVIRSDAVLLQRTSNRRQRRRLIAAIVRQSQVPGGRGFVSENHTIAILPDPAARRPFPLALLCRLLNTAAVDARFRRMSGSVSISTIGLRELPLPHPSDVRREFEKKNRTDDEAVSAAYVASALRTKIRGRRRTENQARQGPS